MACASRLTGVHPAAVNMSDVGFAALCEPLATRALMRLLLLDVRCAFARPWLDWRVLWLTITLPAPGNPRMKDRAAKRMMVVVAYDGVPNLQLLNMRGHRMSHRTIRLLQEACDGYFDLIV